MLLFSLHLLKTIYYGKKSRREENSKERTFEKPQKRKKKKNELKKIRQSVINKHPNTNYLRVFVFYSQTIDCSPDCSENPFCKSQKTFAKLL